MDLDDLWVILQGYTDLVYLEVKSAVAKSSISVHHFMLVRRQEH